MIAFIEGKIIDIDSTYVVIDVGGVGYLIYISLRNFEEIKEKKTVKLHTHLQVREDAHLLYGFVSIDERAIFKHLISVSGVGPSTAMLVLSTLSLEEIQHAIVNADAKTIQTVKGIGEKTAKRITIDLKDKIKISSHSGLSAHSITTDSSTKEKAIAALVALGYNKTDAIKSVTKVCQVTKGELDVQNIVKIALKVT